MKHLILIPLLALNTHVGQAQDCKCNLQPESRRPTDIKKLEDEYYFKISGICTPTQGFQKTDAIQNAIAAVDVVINGYFNDAFEEQLRGRLGSKLVHAKEHAEFLCNLERLRQRLDTTLKATYSQPGNLSVSSLKPVFLAYLNSLKIYRQQTRNLVEWENRQPGKRNTYLVPVHEGNIDDYYQAHQFMELCKNNLLKECSVIELTETAGKLQIDAGKLQATVEKLQADVESLKTSLDEIKELVKQNRSRTEELKENPLAETKKLRKTRH